MSTAACSLFFRQNGFRREDGVWYAGLQTPDSDNGQMYHSLRTEEGWLYADEIVKDLPDIDRSDPHAPQWEIRKRSLKRLIGYLSLHAPGSTLLDLGCGNGWMANGFARAGFSVCALDLNDHELQQGARVFEKTSDIEWLSGNIFGNILPLRYFKTIVLASSAQYFPDLRSLIARLSSLLTDDGEIHIIDTPFYSPKHRGEAVERSRQYYAKIGFPAFTSRYHHHTFDEIADYRPEIRVRTNAILNLCRKLAGHQAIPFPWIIVRPSCSSAR
jgi:ubiquinone/menaquinone biosynthesis C-methylase UbiE